MRPSTRSSALVSSPIFERSPLDDRRTDGSAAPEERSRAAGAVVAPTNAHRTADGDRRAASRSIKGAADDLSVESPAVRIAIYLVLQVGPAPRFGPAIGIHGLVGVCRYLIGDRSVEATRLLASSRYLSVCQHSPSGDRFQRGDGRLRGSRRCAWAARGLGFVLAPLLLVMSWRAWVVGIHVEAGGVKVVGFLLSKRFRWDEIDHFAVLPLGGYPHVGHVVLRNGRQVGTYGIGAPGRPKSRRRLSVPPSGAAANRRAQPGPCRTSLPPRLAISAFSFGLNCESASARDRRMDGLRRPRGGPGPAARPVSDTKR